MQTAREFNFDGLVGPSHNYAGLSFGNVASSGNAGTLANPRQAALQGLAKMRALAARGFAQALLPPHPRPDFKLLHDIGFSGSDAAVLARAARDAPTMLAAAYSAAPMWCANAATVSPGFDCADGRCHFTVANLNNKLHRANEHVQSVRSLRAIFADTRHFAVHDALPSSPALGDEGAANHSRLAATYSANGVELFVYGRRAMDDAAPGPARFPARQTLEASQAITRLHGLQPERTLFIQQNPGVIDQGVFHNDVIAVGNGNVLLYHEQAFLNEKKALADIGSAMEKLGATLIPLRVTSAEISVADAVQSYIFNSQLLTKPDGKMLLLVPQECQNNQAVARYLQDLSSSSGGPVDELMQFDLHQSMRNGGGPACLRLRVVLTAEQAQAMHPGIIFTEALYQRLVAWVERHYRDRLALQDLADPALALEIATALESLSEILGLPGLYQLH